MTSANAAARDVAATAASTGVSTPRRGPGHLETLMAPSLAVAAAGTRRRMIVLATDGTECIAVDVETGALVRAHSGNGAYPEIEPYETISVGLTADGDIPDPAQPEAVHLQEGIEWAPKLKGRQVKRYLEDLLVPAGEPLLGFPGPATPYWTLTGANPSVSLIRSQGEIEVYVRPEEGVLRAGFSWNRSLHQLPISGDTLVAKLAAALSYRKRLAGESLERALGHRPHYLLVTLTQPFDGHCYKVVSGLLGKP